MVALTWIKTQGHWNTFVGNRVKEITSVSNVNDWRHVPGHLNPADVASRGCSSKTLVEKQWWKGPEWLKNDPKHWPNVEIYCTNDEVDKERKKTVTSCVSNQNQWFTQIFKYFSVFTKITRMIAWLFRFCYNANKENHRKSGPLTFDEIEHAEICLFRAIQNESFSENMDVLQNINLFRSEDGLLRVKTKLILSDDSFDFKYPIILPYKHELVERMIRQQHRIHCHIGVQTLLGLLREKFWILKGRKFVKDVVAKCLICMKHKKNPADTPYAPLPLNRIKQSSPFQVTGVDLAGPLFLKGGEKSWIVIFTCAVYRAVHFELVRSLSTEDFLMALRRFVARRGNISVIYSDNGGNFVGTWNLLQKISWKEIEEYSTTRKIKWIFNAPTAPWWGGWWERIVRIIKELLRRNLGKSSLNYEELMTVLCDCEANINARPLTYISSSEDDLIPLTPLMFISSNSSTDTPELDMVDRGHLLKRYKYLQKLREGLRSRFRKEYLAELVHTGQKRVTSLKIGDIVLIEVTTKNE
ncbi:uncharacterized protein [Leptinotarsa decemlineata]|uniref:uncharacterized protein n=1 Tax=Leptinotarsa decemlineata TaxID=7539 RepID=UPI003D307FFB